MTLTEHACVHERFITLDGDESVDVILEVVT